jgi:hypothetical protein
VLVAALVLSGGRPASADPLDPQDFASLGTLVLANGSFTIDTDAREIRDGASAVLFTGVVDDQDGRADSFGGTPGPLGIPEIAVFTFDAIDIQSTATITLTGSRALALLSRGDALVDTTLDASGGDAAGAVAGGGRLGGFAGGSSTTAGAGPGGGSPSLGHDFVNSQRGGSGSFGGLGVSGIATLVSGPAGPTYGDLSDLLQGGSGGGGYTDPGVAGGAGGGALEIGAVRALVIGPAGLLAAHGGRGAISGSKVGGGGSGGGIRLHADAFALQGSVRAEGRATSSNAFGGGGRVFLSGGAAHIGPAASLKAESFLGGVSVSAGAATHGVVTVVPAVTLVGAGGVHTLGDRRVLQTQSTTQPTIELIPRDLAVHAGGEVTVPSAGFANAARIELRSPLARITGSGELANAGRIVGPGRVEAPLRNVAGGRVSVVVGALVFAQPVTNEAGGRISAIGATLDFGAAGLVNQGELRLLDSVVLQP